MLSTSEELHFGLELPVAISNIAGNAEEAGCLFENNEQIHEHHECNVKIDIADSKYDTIINYEYLRAKRSIPVIDYNSRNEKLSRDALLERGYDQNGWPFAPCKLLYIPNRFDEKRKRLVFCCFKQCLSLKYKAMEDLNNHYDVASCPWVKNPIGFVSHMYVKEYPRLINKIPRGSKRYKQIRKLRSASERANSSLKEDLRILDKPRVLNSERANFLSQMAGIVLLLKRALSCVAKITILMKKFYHANDPSVKKKLRFRYIPKFILKIIQRE